MVPTIKVLPTSPVITGALIITIFYSAVALPQEGPVLVVEPPAIVRVNNTSNTVLTCEAVGSPPPTITWVDSKGRSVHPISSLRDTLENGSLVFRPISSKNMISQEVHNVRYRCAASNTAGTVLSREVYVFSGHAVTPHLSNVFALRDNVATLKCDIRDNSFHTPFAVSWKREDFTNKLGLVTVQHQKTGKFIATSGGSLHVTAIVPEDAQSRFYCVHSGQISASAQIVVTDPEGKIKPRIEHATINERAYPGRPVDLSCSAQGYPAPKYRWFRVLPNEEKYEIGPARESEYSGGPRNVGSVLRWNAVEVSDAGRYVCEASNDLGEDRRTLTLNVISPLKVSLQPPHSVADGGSQTQFNCSASGGAGTAKLGITWFKDGRMLESRNTGERIRISERDLGAPPIGAPSGAVLRSWLRIESVEPDDRGMYQCSVTTVDDSAQASAELALGAVAPRLLSTFLEQTLNQGAQLALRCSADGTLPLRVSWLLDGAPLPLMPPSPEQSDSVPAYQQAQHQDATGVEAWLNATSVSVQHGGMYACVARNSVGKAIHEAAVNVYGPPTPRSLLNLTAVAGTRVVRLRCPVGGFPLTVVSWERPNGESVPFDPLNNFLVLRDIDTKRHAGEYKCTATNSQGVVAHGRIYLRVLQPPKIAAFQFHEGLIAGNRAQVLCSVISGETPMTIVWRKDGSALARNDPRIQVQTQEAYSMLLISEVAAEHAGRYMCVASNDAASANHSSDLVVKVPPSWVNEPRDTAVLYQEAAEIPCLARGHPIPVATWHKHDGSSMMMLGSGASAHSSRAEGSARLQFHVTAEGTLRIPNVSPHLQGRYTCKADNGIGAPLSKTVVLRVNVPVHIIDRGENVTAVAGGTALLRCNANGDAPLRLSWSAHHRVLRPEEVQTRSDRNKNLVIAELELNSISRSDAGRFRCSAANEYGHDEMIVHLSVQEPPGAPGRPFALESGSRWIRLTWNPPPTSVRHERPFRYVVQYRSLLHDDDNAKSWHNVSVNAGQLTTQLDSLSPATPYQIRVLAVNEVGAGPPSEEVLARTLPEAPTGPPLDISVEASAMDALIVRWKPPLPGMSNGIIEAYQVGHRVASAQPAPGPSLLTSSSSSSTSNSAIGMSWRIVRGGGYGAVNITGLRPYTTYEVSVRAVNGVGAGPPSTPVSSTTKEGPPSAAPTSVHCTPQSPQSLRVRWLAPPAGWCHGIIQGYKVFYRLVDDGRTDGPPPVGEVKKSKDLVTDLHGLVKYGNYSVRVAAFTNGGEGVRSAPLHCLTEEDVPGPITTIKAVPNGVDSILVAWRPPLQPNGVITKYTINHQCSSSGAATKSNEAIAVSRSCTNDIHRETVPGNRLMHEIRRVSESHRYEFWVTASTHAGEGLGGTHATTVATAQAPARVAAFGGQMRSISGTSVAMTCPAAGSPPPVRNWSRSSGLPGDRSRVMMDGSLRIDSVVPADAGSYVCNVRNAGGSDEIHWSLIVVRTPGQPELTVTPEASLTLRVEWSVPDDGGLLVSSVVIAYRPIRTEWQQQQADPDIPVVNLSGLKCGTVYQVRCRAANAAGRGAWSKETTAKIPGGPPLKADPSEVLTVNSTAATLLADAWPSGGCPLLYLEVRLRSWSVPGGNAGVGGAWGPLNLLSNKARPDDSLTLADLSPGSWYALEVTAHNEAGSVIQEMVFGTRTADGAAPPPALAPPPSDAAALTPLFQPHVVASVASAALCALAMSVCLFVLLRRRRLLIRSKEDVYVHASLAELQNRRNNAAGHLGQPPPPPPPPPVPRQRHLYSPSLPHKGDSSLVAQKGSDTSGGDYDICPYATLSVSGKQQVVSSSGAADYSLHLRTFSQRDCGDSAPRRTSAGRSITNSPPDGLNLGSLRRPLDRARDRDRIWARSEAQHLTDLSITEISCISSQQTLPLADVPGSAKGRAGRGRSRSRCGPSDSDSGGRSPRRRQYRVPTPSHRSEAFPSGDRDSSSDSPDASPELARRTRRPVRSGSSGSSIVTANINGGCRRGVLR